MEEKENTDKAKYIKDLLEIDYKDIDRDKLIFYLSRYVENNKLMPPRLNCYDRFTLPANKLKCTKGQSFITTVGKYLFNLYCIEASFDGKIEYVNKHLDPKNVSAIDRVLSGALINKIIIPSEMREYFTRITWFCYALSEMTLPGMSMDMVGLSPKLEKIKKKLIEDNKKLIEENDIVGFKEKVEKPLMKAYIEEHKDNPSIELYDKKMKPTIDVALAKPNVMNGIIPDSLLGSGYKISTNSYMDGMDPKDMVPLGNEVISAFMARSIETRDGGAYVKKIIGAFQGEYIGDPGTDCKTKLTYKIKVTEDNFNDVLFAYAYDKNENLIEILPEMKDKVVGKTIRIRSLMYCKSRPYCSKCAGTLFYRTNMRAIGMLATKMGSVILYISMKKIHDVNISLIEIDPSLYMRTSKEMTLLDKKESKSRTTNK